MDSLFNRTRSKVSSRSSRQQPELDSFGSSDSDLRALPYDRTTLTRPPPFAGAQSSRQQTGSSVFISAPLTNPGLTSNGTDLNINSHRERQKERAEQRERRRDNASNEGGLYSVDEESSSLRSYSRASTPLSRVRPLRPNAKPAVTPMAVFRLRPSTLWRPIVLPECLQRACTPPPRATPPSPAPEAHPPSCRYHRPHPRPDQGNSTSPSHRRGPSSRCSSRSPRRATSHTQRC
jgi:hypothetical protein